MLAVRRTRCRRSTPTTLPPQEARKVDHENGNHHRRHRITLIRIRMNRLILWIGDRHQCEWVSFVAMDFILRYFLSNYIKLFQKSTRQHYTVQRG